MDHSARSSDGAILRPVAASERPAEEPRDGNGRARSCAIEAELPPHVRPAYDGLVIDI